MFVNKYSFLFHIFSLFILNLFSIFIFLPYSTFPPFIEFYKTHFFIHITCHKVLFLYIENKKNYRENTTIQIDLRLWLDIRRRRYAWSIYLWRIG